MKDVKENFVGKFAMKVGLDVREMKLGAFHETIIGIESTFIGGSKRETVVGAEIRKTAGIKYDKVNGARIEKGKAEHAKDYPEAIRKVKKVYKEMASDFVKEAKKSIQATCDQYKIGAKMMQQDVEDLAVKAKNEIVHQAKTVKMTAETAWEVEAKKAKHTLVSLALLAKVSVNDGNWEVKK
jgi:hypothetical protein